MTNKQNDADDDDETVRLNEAFERLEKQQDEDSAKAAAVDAPAPRAETVVRRASSLPGILGLVLALIAIGIAGYAAWTVYTQTQALSGISGFEARVTSVDQRVDGNQTRMGELSKQQNLLSTRIDGAETANRQSVDQLQKQVAASLAQMRASLGTSSRDWLYAEVEYLLRLANQRVIMEGNVKGALTLFQDADNIIRQSDGITAFDLRKAIADNIAQLQAVSEVDVDGIYVRLSALAGQAQNLRQQQKVFERAKSPPEPATVATGFTAQLLALVKSAGTRLATLVDFRRNGERIKPILPPKEEYYLHQNLVLKIQMAQMALLRGDQTIYVSSLIEAQDWVKAHFDPNDSATSAMLKTLSDLAAIDIAQKMPDVSSSLKEVRKLMASFQAEPPRADEPPQAGEAK